MEIAPRLPFCAMLMAGSITLAGVEEGKKDTGKNIDLETVCGWLPEDTESLFVVQGFRVHLDDPENLESEEVLKLSTLKLFSLAQSRGPQTPGPVLRAFDKARIKAGVSAARNFRSPRSLGSVKFEGCSIAVFEEAGDARKVWEVVKSHGKDKLDGIGSETFQFETTLEDDTWRVLLTRPLDTVILCATDKGYLEHILKGVNGEQRKASFLEIAGKRDEWKAIDRDSEIWGLRIFRPENAAKDPGSPLNKTNVLGKHDPGAKGQCFAVNKNRDVLEALYFTGSKGEAEIARGYFNFESLQIESRIDVTKPGVARFRIQMDEFIGGNMRYLILILTGHIIFI